MDIFEYIEKAKNKSNSKSYSELAEKIGISKEALSKIRRGGPPSESTILKIAKLAKENPLEVMSEYKVNKAKTKEEEKFWRSLLRTAAGVTAIYIATSFGPAIENVEANQSVGKKELNKLYIMRIYRSTHKRPVCAHSSINE